MAMSVEQIKKLIEATARASSALGAMLEDKRVSLRDLKHLPGLLDFDSKVKKVG